MVRISPAHKQHFTRTQTPVATVYLKSRHSHTLKSIWQINLSCLKICSNALSASVKERQYASAQPFYRRCSHFLPVKTRSAEASSHFWCRRSLSSTAIPLPSFPTTLTAPTPIANNNVRRSQGMRLPVFCSWQPLSDFAWLSRFFKALCA